MSRFSSATIEPLACRRFVAALLLQACLDGHRGSREALVWLHSVEASEWAELLEIDGWPPMVWQLGSRNELKRRARVLSENL